MVNPNVAWKKYLNSSNLSINRYLKTYGDSLLQQTLTDYHPQLNPKNLTSFYFVLKILILFPKSARKTISQH